MEALEILKIQASIDEAESILKEAGIQIEDSPWIVKHNESLIIGRHWADGFYFSTKPGGFKPSLELNALVTTLYTWIFDSVQRYDGDNDRTSSDLIMYQLVHNVTGEKLTL